MTEETQAKPKPKTLAELRKDTAKLVKQIAKLRRDHRNVERQIAKARRG